MDENKLKLEIKKAEERTTIIKRALNTTGIVGGVVALITAINPIYTTCIEHKEFKLTNKESSLTTELNYINNFIDSALTEDIGVRLRLSEYFKSVSPTTEQRDRWEKYYLIVKEEFKTKTQQKDSIRTK